MRKENNSDRFCFQKICELLESNGEKKEPYPVFCDIMKDVLDNDLDEKKYFSEFYKDLLRKYPVDEVLLKKKDNRYNKSSFSSCFFAISISCEQRLQLPKL